MEIKVKWTGKMAFTGENPSGHVVKMDASEKMGGEDTGARPTELLLNAVAGCTGIDIISILKKMRLDPTSLDIVVKGNRAQDHPKSFTTIYIDYALAGNLPEDKVVRAITLSKDKYCSVAHSLNAQIIASYSINGVTGSKDV